MEDYAESIQVLPIINGYKLLFKALTMIPVSHYVLGLLCVSLVLVYNFLEFHFIEDFLSGGSVVKLTYDSGSELYHNVVSKCKILHGRYFATPWLASPHFQTILLEFVGKAPLLSYKRELFQSSDGGTFALDWLLSSDVLGSCDTKSNDNNAISNKNTTTPIVVVVPGLTSDSSAAYIRFYAFNTAKRGWNVVICNHRGMGGVPLTSDHFYNAGKTNDIRDVINHLRDEYPKAPLFLVGISIGANIVGKYLGEDGQNCPVAGAAVVCCPWDLLIGCRFIARKFVQRIYDRILAISLQAYGHLNQAQYSKLADWEGLLKARSIREWNRSSTCVVDKIETVDTYYRWASCASYVLGIAVPLLCISSMDDPVCPAEAIPWDECRLNKNVVLVTTKHGGHLGYFEGLTASSLWWVRAVNEYLSILHSSPLMHKQKKSQTQGHSSIPDTSFGQTSYIASVGNGTVAAVDVVEEKPSRLTTTQNGKAHAMASDAVHLENYCVCYNL